MLKSKNQAGCRLPDFLIIGAMKSGTTSLSCDLNANPAIFLPSVKEPHFLCDDEVLSEKGRRQYARLFSSAASPQICGEASTGYTKLPRIRGVPKRARSVLGPDTRLVYLVRNPVDRAISHHYHMLRAGDISLDIDRAIRDIPELVDYGRYAAQLKPWTDTFGTENVRAVRFEDYVSHRPQVVAQISRFLGVRPQVDAVHLESVANRGDYALAPKLGFKTFVNKTTRSKWYKTYVHAHTPKFLKNALKPVLLRKPVARPNPPSHDTVQYLVDKLQDDNRRLCVLLGLSEPLWDLQAHVQMVSDKGEQCQAA